MTKIHQRKKINYEKEGEIKENAKQRKTKKKITKEKRMKGEEKN